MARINHGVLTPNTVQAVIVPANSNTVEIMIVANASAPIYFRVDGTDPTIGGDNCEVIPAGIGSGLTVDLPARFEVRLISAGSPTYMVKGS